MAIQFSDTAGNTGIAEQALVLAGVDSTQWPLVRISNSCNNWLDKITGYAVGADKRFRWDDTNQSRLPEGTLTQTINVSDYSFLTDQDGNAILTLLRIDATDQNNITRKLIKFDQSDFDDQALAALFASTGIPQYYDPIADNVVRLYPTPNATVTNGLKFFFQRTGSYFTAASTTKAPGVSPLLHRGFIIASAYDIALALGMTNIESLSVELQKEEQKMVQYFADRNEDERKIMTGKTINFRGDIY